MAYGIVFILVLVSVSGLIAYLGDLVGRRVGKKRITLMGIRPKYTSIIVAVATGVFITAFTLTFLLAVSSTYRKALFGLQRIVTDLRDSQRDLGETKSELNISQKGLRETKGELKRVSANYDRKSSELDLLLKSQKQLRVDVEKLTLQRRRLEKDRVMLAADVRDKALQIGDKSKRILYGEIIYTKDMPLARIVVPRGSAEDALTRQMDSVIGNIRAVSIEKGAMIDRDATAILETQVRDLRKNLDSARNDAVIEVRSATNVFAGEPLILKIALIDNRVVYKADEQVVSGQAPAGMDNNQATQFLRELMFQASQKAREEGMIPNAATGKVASVSFPRFTDTVDRITGASKEKTVIIHAVNDTRIADNLLVEFLVRD